MTDLLLQRGAVISPCGLYRYSLTRTWSAALPLPFVMLNPSTADADIDDPTIRRCMAFARREHAGGIIVANVFAYRATSPADLWKATDPFGPWNDDTLETVAREWPRCVAVRRVRVGRARHEEQQTHRHSRTVWRASYVPWQDERRASTASALRARGSALGGVPLTLSSHRRQISPELWPVPQGGRRGL